MICSLSDIRYVLDTQTVIVHSPEGVEETCEDVVAIENWYSVDAQGEAGTLEAAYPKFGMTCVEVQKALSTLDVNKQMPFTPVDVTPLSAYWECRNCGMESYDWSKVYDHLSFIKLAEADE